MMTAFSALALPAVVSGGDGNAPTWLTVLGVIALVIIGLFVVRKNLRK